MVSSNFAEMTPFLCHFFFFLIDVTARELWSTHFSTPFTCRKSTTWVQWIYFPSEEGMLRICSPQKSNGFGRV
jgi:hypothetical protein